MAETSVARIRLVDLPEGEQELLTQFLCAEDVKVRIDRYCSPERVAPLGAGEMRASRVLAVC
jgi:hypothetical protein